MEGSPDPVTGMVLDLKALKETLNREVVEIYDHRFLNREVAPFDRRHPDAGEYRHRHLESPAAAFERAARQAARRARLRDAGPLCGLFWRRAADPGDAQVSLFGVAPAARPAARRRGEPGALRQVQQSLRTRPQLRDRGDRARPAGAAFRPRGGPRACWTAWCGARCWNRSSIATSTKRWKLSARPCRPPKIWGAKSSGG